MPTPLRRALKRSLLGPALLGALASSSCGTVKPRTTITGNTASLVTLGISPGAPQRDTGKAARAPCLVPALSRLDVVPPALPSDDILGDWIAFSLAQEAARIVERSRKNSAVAALDACNATNVGR